MILDGEVREVRDVSASARGQTIEIDHDSPERSWSALHLSHRFCLGKL